MIPGINLLNMVHTIIQTQEFGYSRFLSRTTNDIALDIPAFEPEVILKGSVQPVARALTQEMGLDWKRKHINIHVSHDVRGVGRDSSGDRVTFDGKTFQVLSEPTDWFPIDGWTSVLCVEIPA